MTGGLNDRGGGARCNLYWVVVVGVAVAMGMSILYRLLVEGNITRTTEADAKS